MQAAVMVRLNQSLAPRPQEEASAAAVVARRPSDGGGAPGRDSPLPRAKSHRGGRFVRPGSRGLILSNMFSYIQDPRQVHWKEKRGEKPSPRTSPTFETIFQFHATVIHHDLRAIVFHDDESFDEAFVRRHASEPQLTFVRVEPPEFGADEPEISPNDFRFVAFDRWMKANVAVDGDGRATVDGVDYEWFVVADLDVFFNRDIFAKFEDYAARRNVTFFGSWDGGTWADETIRLQRRSFRECYGEEIFSSWREDVEWKTQNGNAGLWAGRHDQFACVMECMARQYDGPPVRGKTNVTVCDMATHDYCVHYGGCFPGGRKGIYDEVKAGVLWGSASQGERHDLLGPQYSGYLQYRQCDREDWSAVHDRCRRHGPPCVHKDDEACHDRGPICFKKADNGDLVKFHQTGTRGRKCKLGPDYLPIETATTAW
ncbi:hypothetical protein ACHAWF_005123 [Thalassiosira exigua]